MLKLSLVIEGLYRVMALTVTGRFANDQSVYKGLRVLFISFNGFTITRQLAINHRVIQNGKFLIVSSAPKKSLHVRKRFYVMAATGGNTGDARQASQGKTTGLQCDQERKSFA